MMNSSNNTTVVMAGGYSAPPPQTTVVINKKSDNACRAAIPAMHIIMAVFCLILNIFVPGIGTIFAGFSVWCCANKGQSPQGKVGTMCINFWVGLLQIGTVWFFLLGWIWSIMWGAAFLGMSADYHDDGDDTTIITTGGAPAPPPQPIIISNNSSNMMGMQQQAPQQQAPPPQQQQPPPYNQGQPQQTQVPGQAW